MRLLSGTLASCALQGRAPWVGKYLGKDVFQTRPFSLEQQQQWRTETPPATCLASLQGVRAKG